MTQHTVTFYYLSNKFTSAIVLMCGWNIIVHPMFTEPGYIATSALLAQSALCIVDNRDQMPER